MRISKRKVGLFIVCLLVTILSGCKTMTVQEEYRIANLSYRGAVAGVELANAAGAFTAEELVEIKRLDTIANDALEDLKKAAAADVPPDKFGLYLRIFERAMFDFTAKTPETDTEEK